MSKVIAPLSENYAMTTFWNSLRFRLILLVVIGMVPMLGLLLFDYHEHQQLGSLLSSELVARESRQLVMVHAAWMVVALALGIAAAWTFAYLFVMRKAGVVIQAARRLAAGDFAARTNLTDKDGEFGELGMAFDQISDELATREKDRDEALAKAEREQELSQMILDGLPGPFYVFDEQGRMKRWNHYFKGLDGYSSEEIARMNPLDFIAKEDRTIAEKAIQEGFANGESSAELTWLTKTGAAVPFYFTSRKVNIEGTDCLVGMGLDISARKKAEQELAQSGQMLKDILATSPVGISLNENRVIQWANDAWEKLFGFEEPDEYVGKNARILYPSDEEYERVGRALYGDIQPGMVTKVDAIMRRKDGSLFHADNRLNLRKASDPEKRVVIAAVTDISERKQREAELLLRDSAMASSISGITIVDLDGNMTYGNPAALRLWGYDHEKEVLGKRAIEFWITQQEALDAVKEAVNSGAWIGELVARRKDGSPLDVQAVITGVKDSEGKPVGLMGSFLDITERKRAEQALRDSEERYRILVENANELVCVVQDGKFVFANPKALSESGYSLEELITMPFPEVVHPDDRAIPLQLYQKTMSGEEAGDASVFRVVDKWGRTRWGLASVVRIEWNGKPAALVLGTDITSLKEAEEEILKEKAFSDGIMDSIPGLFYVLDEQGGFLRWNKNLEIVSGYGADEVGRMRALDFFEGEDSQIIEQGIQEVLVRGEAFREAQFMCKDGTKIPYLFTGKLLQLNDVNCLVGVGIDLSGRKQIELALSESERRFRAIFENTELLSGTLDADGNTTFCNAAFLSLTGYESSEVIGKNWFDLFLSENTSNIVKEQYSRAVISGSLPVHNEWNIRTRDADERSTRWTNTHLRDLQGKIIGIASIGEDITELKKAEEELRRSEENLKGILAACPVGLDRVSLDRTLVWANNAWMEMFGFDSEEDYVGKNASILYVSQEEYERVGKELYEQLLVNEIAECDGKLRRKDGSVFDGNVRVTAVDRGDLTKGAIAAVTDISDRKRAEEKIRSDREMLQGIMNTSPVGIGLTRNRTIQWVNRAWLKMFGFGSESECVGKPTNILYTSAEDYERAREAVYGKLEDEPVGEADVVFRRTDASLFDANLRITVLDPSDPSKGTISAISDISDRKKSEEALRRSEQRYRNLFNDSMDGIYSITREGQFLDANQSFLDILGYEREELMEKRAGQIYVRSEDREAFRKEIEAKGSVKDYEIHLRRKDGNVIDCLLTSTLIKGDDGAILGYQGILRDITRRKWAEEALRASEQRYRLHFENASDVLYSLDTELRIVSMSPSVTRILGYATEEMIGKPFTELNVLAPESLESALSDTLRVFAGERVDTAEYEFAAKDGTRVFGEVSAAPIVEGGKVVGVTAIARDITERKRSEEERLRLMTAIEQSAETILIAETDGTIEYTNPAVERTSGYARGEVIGRNPRMFRSGKHDKAFYADMWGTLASGKTWSGRFINKKKDGSLYEEEATISPVKDLYGKIVNYVAVKRDVTEETHLQKQLLQAQKMEAVGTLAGGIAHDFNNILTVVLGYADLALVGKDQDSENYSDLQVIRSAAQRGADLVKQILTFSRKAEANPRPIDLNQNVEHAHKLLSKTIPKMIQIELRLAENLHIINADPAQIEQILLNLAVNAHHAMPEGGKLVFTTNNVVLDDEYARMNPEVAPGEYVELTVSDTGHGMASEVMERIFEPFFSTRKAEGGTGLGLSTVFGIMKSHGGHIKCYSESGMGTTFKCYFPAMEQEETIDEPTSGLMPAFGTETVLLVDDEDLIRAIAARMLSRGGYTVLTAGNGKEGIEVFKTERKRISLVILDLIMPEMSGHQCLEELLKIDPVLKVVIASGFAVDAPTMATLEAKVKGFVTKPFKLKELLQAVRRILDET